MISWASAATTKDRDSGLFCEARMLAQSQAEEDCQGGSMSRKEEKILQLRQ
jgi:hypothetical protein